MQQDNLIDVFRVFFFCMLCGLQCRRDLMSGFCKYFHIQETMVLRTLENHLKFMQILLL